VTGWSLKKTRCTVCTLRIFSGETRAGRRFFRLCSALSSCDVYRAGYIEREYERKSMNWFTRHKKISIIGAALLVLLLVYYTLSFSSPTPILWGVQFNKGQAEYLGLDWRAAYSALLDDAGVRALRLGAYWNDIERTQGAYMFDDLDWQIAEAKKRDAKILLVIGRRLPRWPECHIPLWAAALSEEEQQRAVLLFMENVVRRYTDETTVEMWQVENEPFLSFFGECPEFSPELLQREIAAVRALDDRPIVITDSGELSSWRKTAPLGDYFGTTMYRIVWNQYVGYWSYDYIFSPAFYRLKAWLVGKPVERVFNVELQAEPWAPEGILSLSLDEQRRSMNEHILRKHIRFAKRTGIPRVYFWGSEYWYWLKEKQGEESLWNIVKETFGQ